MLPEPCNLYFAQSLFLCPLLYIETVKEDVKTFKGSSETSKLQGNGPFIERLDNQPHCLTT